MLPVDIIKEIIFLLGDDVRNNHSILLASKLTNSIVHDLVAQNKKKIPVRRSYGTSCYYMINGELVGKFSKFYSNKSGIPGNPKLKSICYYDERGVQDGTFMEWDREGNIINNLKFKDGSPYDGTYTYYSGDVTVKAFYQNGKKEGLKTVWLSGVRDVTYNYSNGLKNGECIHYFHDGVTVGVKCFYKNNTLHGPHTVYKLDGEIEKEKFYIDGREVH